MLFAWENFNLCQHCFPVLFLTMRARDLTSILFFFFPLSWVLPVKCLPPKLGTEGLDLKQCLLRGSFQQFKNHSHSLASIMSHWDFKNHPSGEQKMQSKNPKGFLCCPSLWILLPAWTLWHQAACYARAVLDHGREKNRLLLRCRQRPHSSSGSREKWCTTAGQLCFTSWVVPHRTRLPGSK